MTKPKFQLECLEGRLTPTVSFFLVPPEVPSGAYSIGSYDSDQPDAAQPTVAILGLADGETPVALTESADGTSSFLLAASASALWNLCVHQDCPKLSACSPRQPRKLLGRLEGVHCNNATQRLLSQLKLGLLLPLRID